MGPLIVRCPTTHLSLDTGIAADLDSLARNWTCIVRVRCPHCKGKHEVTVREAVFASEREGRAFGGAVARAA